MRYTPDIKTFIKIMIIFYLPFFVLVGISIFFSIYSGEISLLSKVVEKQAGDEEYIFARRVIGRETEKYKYLNIEHRSPEILAVGSSRILQLRKEMFGSAYTFYNAGSIVGNLNDLVDLIDLLPEENTPQIMIVGIDIWWFDVENINKRRLLGQLAKGEEFYNWKAYVYSGRRVLTQIVKNPSYILDVFNGRDPFSNQKSIGIDALENGNGFRNDGSRQYATYLTEIREDMTYVDREIPPVVERVQEGYQPFSLNSVFDDRGLVILDEFLTKSKERGIQVIAIASPFASDAYAAMMNSYYAPFVRAFREELPKVFKKHEFAYFDFTDFASWGVEDVYMLDGFHQTETGMAIMFVNILDEVCKKNLFADCKHTQQRLIDILDDPQTTPAEMNLNNL